jgi:hypothetical protein
VYLVRWGAILQPDRDLCNRPSVLRAPKQAMTRYIEKRLRQRQRHQRFPLFRRLGNRKGARQSFDQRHPKRPNIASR